MYAVWSWLCELCEFDRALSTDDAVTAFTDAGLEVESVTRVGADFSGVVLAQVVGKRPHPAASKLTLVDLIVEPGGAATEVVCGAPNVPEPGGLVLWAPPGAVLPGGRLMGKKTIKGIESAGMICAEDELGLGDDHEGIIVIDPERDVLVSGPPLFSDADALARLGLSDTVFEIGVHANRPDCLGHLGLARELVALVGGRVTPVAPALDEFLSPALTAEELASVSIADVAGCPRYIARVIDGVAVGPSPRWMRQRLRSVGVRPLSNLVDITNYVMFELGQPMHAFDYREVAGAHIEVRRARSGERMVTLDDVERVLEPTDLLICDAERPVALAGVMGGANSEVSDTTTRVLLESASFAPHTVRATARRLGLHSEASHRFERGVDPNLADLASRRACELMARHAGGPGGAAIARGEVDVYPTRAEPWRVSVRASRASLLTGVSFTRERAAELLGRLDIEVVNDPNDDDTVHVTVPTYRADLAREADLIEEIIRIHGMHNVPATLPDGAVHRTQVVDDRPQRARAALVAAGMTEAIMFGFTSRERLDALFTAEGDPRRRVVALQNPMTKDQAVMRTSLLPNLLGAVAKNASFGEHEVALFEVGNVFWANAPGELPDEPVFVTGVMTGTRMGWLNSEAPLDFFDIKGVVERLLIELLGDREAANVRFEAARDVPYMHPGVCAAVYVPVVGEEHAHGAGQGTPARRLVGHVGEVHPRTRQALAVEQPCFAFDFALDAFPRRPLAEMREIPRYPAVTRDISIFVDQHLPADRVRELIESQDTPLIEHVAVLEEYRDATNVPEGKKGLLWTITYRSSEGTLTDERVDATHEALVKELLERLPAQRR